MLASTVASSDFPSNYVPSPSFSLSLLHLPCTYLIYSWRELFFFPPGTRTVLECMLISPRSLCSAKRDASPACNRIYEALELFIRDAQREARPPVRHSKDVELNSLPGIEILYYRRKTMARNFIWPVRLTDYQYRDVFDVWAKLEENEIRGRDRVISVKAWIDTSRGVVVQRGGMK